MRIRRDYVLCYLTEKQDKKSGYFGSDISDLAKEMGISDHGLRRRLSKWIKEDKDFSNLIYLGKHRSRITHSEFLEIRKRIHSNPQEVKSHTLLLLENSLDWFKINL